MSRSIICATCGRGYQTPRLFNGPGHRGMCEKPVESLAAIKTVTFDVVQYSGENEIGRERLTTTDDQDMIDNAISELLEGWILAIGDKIEIVEVE